MSDVFYITGNGDPRDWQLHDTWGDAYDTIRPDLEAGAPVESLCIMRIRYDALHNKVAAAIITRDILCLAAIDAARDLDRDGGGIAEFPHHLIDYAPPHIQQMAEERWANEARADDE